MGRNKISITAIRRERPVVELIALALLAAARQQLKETEREAVQDSEAVSE